MEIKKASLNRYLNAEQLTKIATYGRVMIKSKNRNDLIRKIFKFFVKSSFHGER